MQIFSCSNVLVFSDNVKRQICEDSLTHPRKLYCLFSKDITKTTATIIKSLVSRGCYIA